MRLLLHSFKTLTCVHPLVRPLPPAPAPPCLQAVLDRDPACDKYTQCLLYFKGFQAVQCHRVGHALWQRGRKVRGGKVFTGLGAQGLASVACRLIGPLPSQGVSTLSAAHVV
jgi:hypothetical protein